MCDEEGALTDALGMAMVILVNRSASRRMVRVIGQSETRECSEQSVFWDKNLLYLVCSMSLLLQTQARLHLLFDSLTQCFDRT